MIKTDSYYYYLLWQFQRRTIPFGKCTKVNPPLTLTRTSGANDWARLTLPRAAIPTIGLSQRTLCLTLHFRVCESELKPNDNIWADAAYRTECEAACSSIP
jgi:hypothetical protein